MKTPIVVMFCLLLLISCGEKDVSILFSSSRNGNSDIFSMKMDGSSVLQLTQSEYEEWGAVWVNRNEICFLRQLEDRIVRVKKNLSTETEIEIDHPTICILDDKNALYQPNTALQTFPCNGDIYFKKEQETINLTEHIKGQSNYPSWASSNKVIVFTSNHEGSNDIYSIEIETKKLSALTTHPANDERGEVSPNGRLLAFSTDRFEKGNQDIAIKDLNTQKVTRLTNAKGFDLIARWAGNNETLLIGSNSTGNWEIYSLNINDKELVQLTNENSFDGDPRVFIK